MSVCEEVLLRFRPPLLESSGHACPLARGEASKCLFLVNAGFFAVQTPFLSATKQAII